MYEINKREFGAFVAELRKEQGMTQKDLAEKLFISDKAISKWETGVSIPDVSLLIPLSELLGVTVTELLQCRRGAEALDTDQVEKLLKTAVSYAEEDQRSSRPNWRKQLPKYLLFAIAAAIETLAVLFFFRESPQASNLMLMQVMMIAFCGYFMLVLQEKLPDYYDQNRIQYFSDGFLRMNLPGITYNNRNWPHIRKTLIRSSQAIAFVYPVIFALSELLIPQEWAFAKVFTILIPVLGGLFVPMYIAGKKHQ